MLPPDHSPCQICDNRAKNRLFEAREMMYGLRHPFTYLECAACGCVQLLDPPDDLSPYYPTSYYSYRLPHQPWWTRRLKRARAQYGLFGRGLAGHVLTRRYGIPAFVSWVQQAGVGLDDAILDVGSGTGTLLYDMRVAGFSDLTGIDPFIEEDILLPGNVSIYKRTLAEVERSYDFVMLNHAFEHMSGPAKVFEDLFRITRPGRFVLIRIPVADSQAWRTYGTDWIQLDAPRHFFLHTRRSIRLLAEQTGFDLVTVAYDSTGVQFWGSEQYRQDVPYLSDASHRINPKASAFTADEIAAYDEQARQLNATGEGDQACFYLRKP